MPLQLRGGTLVEPTTYQIQEAAFRLGLDILYRGQSTVFVDYHIGASDKVQQGQYVYNSGARVLDTYWWVQTLQHVLMICRHRHLHLYFPYCTCRMY